MVNLKGMNVEALMSLRDQVEKRLVELRSELEKQLAALTGKRKSLSRNCQSSRVIKFGLASAFAGAEDLERQRRVTRVGGPQT